MKIGVMLAIHEWEDKSLHHAIEFSQQAERASLDTVYVPNTIGFDGLTLMTLIGQATQSININSAVIPIQTRHPFAMAQQAKTMALSMPGRFALSVGLSHKMFIEPFYGMSYDHPAKQMEEYLNVMLPLIEQGAVQAEGEFYRSQGMMDIADVEPFAITVAAMGPRMLELTGRLTDGTSLWMTGAKTINDYVKPAISAAATAAGKGAPQIIAGIPVAVTEDRDAARKMLDDKLGMYGMLPSYRGMLDREGLASPTDIAIIGSADEVAAGIAEYKQAGATHFNANILRLDENTTVQTMSLLSAIASPH
jgi:F420-dependent oxidoreductase-like protein